MDFSRQSLGALRSGAGRKGIVPFQRHDKRLHHLDRFDQFAQGLALFAQAGTGLAEADKRRGSFTAFADHLFGLIEQSKALGEAGLRAHFDAQKVMFGKWRAFAASLLEGDIEGDRVIERKALAPVGVATRTQIAFAALGRLFGILVAAGQLTDDTGERLVGGEWRAELHWCAPLQRGSACASGERACAHLPAAGAPGSARSPEGSREAEDGGP